MVDLHMLGACDALLTMGRSSVPSAATSRVFSPQPLLKWSFSFAPTFHAALTTLADEVTAALEAGMPPPPPPDERPDYQLFPGECLVAQAATWGLGSQLVHLLHAMVHVPPDRMYWDFTRSP